MKKESRRRVMVAASVMLALGSLLVLPATSTASTRTAHLATNTCVTTSSATPSPTGIVIVKNTDVSTTGRCDVTVKGQWTPNSTTFVMSDANISLVGPAGNWTSAVASPQFHGTISGIVPAGSSGGTGAGSGTSTGTLGSGSEVAWTITCTLSYPPLRISCTIKIASA